MKTNFLSNHFAIFSDKQFVYVYWVFFFFSLVISPQRNILCALSLITNAERLLWVYPLKSTESFPCSVCTECGFRFRWFSLPRKTLLEWWYDSCSLHLNPPPLHGPPGSSMHSTLQWINQSTVCYRRRRDWRVWPSWIIIDVFIQKLFFFV